MAVEVIERTLAATLHRLTGRGIARAVFIIKYKLGPGLLPTADDIEILHQSPHYIVVNKRYDILINSNDPKDLTVQTQLRHRFPHLVDKDVGHEFRFSHRLDFATSGILCISLHKAAAGAFTRCFTKHQVDKYYLALVRGHLSEEMVDISVPIGDDMRPEWYKIKMATALNPYAGPCKAAHTRVLVLQRGLYSNYPATKVLLKPITGRRHQLRLHLSHIGHTIVGDFSYSNRRDIWPYRMFLHAHRLIVPSAFEHLDLTAQDPFTHEDPRNSKWVPIETLNTLTEETYKRLKDAGSHHCHEEVS